MKTIDLTPTWAAVTPIILAGLTNGTEKGKRLAEEELANMARAADMGNALVAEKAAIVSVGQEMADILNSMKDRHAAFGVVIQRWRDAVYSPSPAA